MTHRVNCHILQAYHLFIDINKYKLQTFEKKNDHNPQCLHSIIM